MMSTDCTRVSEREGEGAHRTIYRKLWFAAVVCLTPIKHVLNFFVILLNPLLDDCGCCYTDDVDDIHCGSWLVCRGRKFLSILERTIVGSDQLISTMIWLAAPNSHLVVNGARGQFVGPVHLVNACINIVLIGSADLEDARDPLTIGLFAATFAIICGLLMVDS